MKKGIALSLITIVGSSLLLSACTSGNTATKTAPAQNVTLKNYTLTEISSHNSAQDCWIAIDNQVYDVTSFIPSHPGGPQITSACGTDGTAAFGKVGKHQGKATSMLPTYKIGTLVE